MTKQPTQPELLREAGAVYNTGPVTCLGMTFADDAERRAYFTARLRDYLHDPAFRAIEGFPLGTDEDILALSDPPYYTACPNPFLPQIKAAWQAERAALPPDDHGDSRFAGVNACGRVADNARAQIDVGASVALDQF